MQKVFISYSWKDEVIALRLYRDLQRLKISTWIDRIDGEPAADFKDEFLRIIGKCDYFIVIDSNNYRHNSNWCGTELKACFDRIDSGDNISLIVCLAEESGAWRNPESMNSRLGQLFNRLNTLKYYALFHQGCYDNNKAYMSSVESICKILGKESYSWDIFPEESDLIDELNHATRSRPGIGDEDYEALKGLLRTIAIRRNAQKNISEHIHLLINDCQELGLNIFLPRWINVIWLADERHEHKMDNTCYECLMSLTQDFPTESRAYRALGAISARLDKQKQAEENFQKALTFIDDSCESSKNIKYEILCNLGQVYMNQCKYLNAKEAMEEAMSFMEPEDLNVRLALNYYECLFFTGNNAIAGTFMGRMVKNNPTVAEFQEYYGYYCLSCGNVHSALPYLINAYSMKPCAEYKHTLLKGLMLCGRSDDYNNLRSETTQRSTFNEEDDDFWCSQINQLPNMI